MSYSAVISKIRTFPHPNADNIQCGTVVSGETVVVDMDTYSGQLGIYFPPDGQLSDEYCRLNNLYVVRGPDGKKIGGGFIDKDRRVRSQTFRGVKSQGLWLPLKSLAAYRRFMDNLQEGTLLSELNGHPLCNKYITEATEREQRVAEILARRSWYRKLLERMGIRQWEEVDMPRHFDTPKVCPPMSEAEVTGTIVTEKLHGTSHRVGKVQILTAPTLWKQILSTVWPWYRPEPSVRYQLVHGTRRREMYPRVPAREQFRLSAFPEGALDNLFLDEILYGEIVGHNGQRPIMADHSPKGTGIIPNHDGKIRYKYGTHPGQCKFYIYRIVQRGRELNWKEVKYRSEHLGIPTVPTVYPTLYLNTSMMDFTAQDCTSELDKTHPREGIVVRIERDGKFPVWVKVKTWAFGIMEGYLRDDRDFVDTEEIA